MDNYNVWRVYGIDAARRSLSVSGERHFVRRSISNINTEEGG